MDLGVDPGGSPSIARSTAQISLVTGVARVAGFARWIFLGVAVGTTYLGNTYQTANLVPNVLFEITAGGLLAAVLVPMFVAEYERGTERVSELASTVANGLLVVSVPLAVIGIVAARPIMRGLLVGVVDPSVRSQQVELGAWFLRFFLPQIPLYLLGMVMQGLLHARRKFIWPAIGPLLSSCTVIATYVLFWLMGPGATLSTVRRSQLWVLAVGTTLGVVALTLCQLPSVLRLGVRWRAVIAWRDPVIRRAITGGGWGGVYIGITQATIVVAVILTNRVEGGVVAFQIANAFFELPNAIIGLPVGISLYPALAAAFNAKDEARYGRLLGAGWRLAVFAAVPAAVGLYVIAGPATETLLGWARHVRPELVAATIRGLAIGVPAWALMATVVRALYARGATARPAVLNSVAFTTVVIVGVGGITLTHAGGPSAMRTVGAAVGLGWCAAAGFGVVMLGRLARGFEISVAVRALVMSLGRSAVMGAVMWTVARAVTDVGPPVVKLLIIVGSGVVALAALSHRSPELRRTISMLGGSGPAPDTT